MVRRRLKALVLFGISAGLLAFVLTRVDIREVGAVFAGANIPLVLVAAAFSLGSFAIMPTLRWQATLTAMGYPISFRSLIFARFGGQPFKFTIPLKGGEAFRAVYVRRRHGVPMTTALASILWDLFLVATGQFAFLCVGLAAAGERVQDAVLPSLGLFGVALVLSNRHVQALAVRIAETVSPRLGGKVRQLAHGFLRFPLPVKLRLVVLSLLVELTEIFSFYLCAHALGLTIPLWAVLAYMPIVMVATLLPISIRGIGTREVAVLFLFAGLATEAQLAGAALLFTFLEFILPALVGCLFLGAFVRVLALDPVDEAPRPEPTHASGPVWTVLATHKRWWLLPALLILAAFLVFVVLTDTGGVAPFVY